MWVDSISRRSSPCVLSVLLLQVVFIMTSLSCFLVPTPIITNHPSSIKNLKPASRRHNPLVCVLDETKSRNPATVDAPANNNKKKVYAFQTSPSVTPANYRVLSDEETSTLPPPPKHYTIPILGYYIDLMLSKTARRDKVRRFGGVYTTNGFFKRMHHITDYNAISEMMNDPDTFRAAGADTKLANIFGEQSLTVNDGEKHAKLRASFIPAFSRKAFPAYFQFVQKRVVAKWASVAREFADGEKVLLDPQFRDLYLAIIIEITTGITKDVEYYAQIIAMNFRLFMGLSSPQYGPIFDDAMKAKAELRDLVSAVIERVLIEQADVITTLRSYGDDVISQGSKELGNTEVNMLLLLLAAEKDVRIGVKNDPIVYQTLAHHIVGIWFAGFTTSAVTSSCTVFEMLRNPSLWNELVAEQEDIIARNQGVRQIEYSQLSEMVKLESVINEALRLHPIAIGVSRKANRDVEVFGRRIEKGDVVWFDFASAMIDDGYYPDGEQFKWDRFLKQEGKKPVPRVLTFSPPGVPHYCIGAQFSYLMMKTAIGELLRSYSIKLDPSASTEYSVFPENVPKAKMPLADFTSRV